MIIINAIMMGIDTYDFESKNDQAFDIVDNIFLILFTIELSLHLFHLGPGFVKNPFKEPWVLFDFVLITLSWCFSDGSVKAARALRILRVLPRVEALRVVIDSISHVVPKLASVGLLLSLVMFIFAILMTELFW